MTAGKGEAQRLIYLGRASGMSKDMPEEACDLKLGQCSWVATKSIEQEGVAEGQDGTVTIDKVRLANILVGAAGLSLGGMGRLRVTAVKAEGIWVARVHSEQRKDFGDWLATQAANGAGELFSWIRGEHRERHDTVTDDPRVAMQKR